MEVYSWEIKCRFVARLHRSRHEPFIWTNLHQPQEWVNPGTSHQFSSYFRKPDHMGLSQTMDFGSVVGPLRDHDHQLQKPAVSDLQSLANEATGSCQRTGRAPARPALGGGEQALGVIVFLLEGCLFLAFQPGFVAFVAFVASVALPSFTILYHPLPCFTYLSIYLPVYLPVYLSTYLPIYLSTYLSIYLSIYLSLYTHLVSLHVP